MSQKDVLLQIDRPHFVVRLYENMLKIDLRGTVKNEIEEALESKPILRETLGRILGMFVPLHIRLSDIDSIKMDRTGKVEITLPHHRDCVLPLEPKDAEKLLAKLNQLIPKEKKRELNRLMEQEKLQKTAEDRLESGRVSRTYGALSPTLEAPKLEEELEAAAEEEEQKKQD